MIHDEFEITSAEAALKEASTVCDRCFGPVPTLASLQTKKHLRRRERVASRVIVSTVSAFALLVALYMWQTNVQENEIADQQTSDTKHVDSSIVAVQPKSNKAIEPAKTPSTALPYRVQAVWTVALPVEYIHPETEEKIQSWAIQDIAVPVDPRQLSLEEQGMVYRVMYGRDQPVNIQL